jgi:D-psicose/D-tagatose/L-ribulose 3-epimerase
VKLAVSSLAWRPEDDQRVRESFSRLGVSAIELAPVKYWPRAPDVPESALAEYRAGWSEAGIVIIALQGILFGRPELLLFGSRQQRAAFEHHLIRCTSFAAALGATVLVLGAPRNRLRGAMSHEEANASAAPLLRRVAGIAESHGVRLCIEPNPSRYGGDFVRNIAEATRLVLEVDHPGFGFHLDAGATAIEQETDADIASAAQIAAHFHISEVDLAPVGSGSMDHRRLARLLRSAGYSGWHSIEMVPAANTSGDVLPAIERAIHASRSSYEVDRVAR